MPAINGLYGMQWGSSVRRLLAAVLLLCNQTAAAEDFRVVVSIKPIHSIVAGLMEGVGKPQLIIGDGQTPYDLHLSDEQRSDMERANLLIWIGPELEASLAQTIETLDRNTQVLELLSSPYLKILPSRLDDNRRDPFFWLDDRNVIILLDDLTRLLQDADPARAHLYVRNRHNMLGDLLRIDKEYEYGYRGLKAGLGVQYYDTLQYFEQAYALTVLERVAESPRRKVDAAALLKVRQRIVDGEAVCIFTDSSMPMEHLSLLTQRVDVNVGELDVLGLRLQAGPSLYLELMRHNTEVIKRCLNADMEAAEHARDLADSDTAPSVEGIGGGRFVLTNQYGQLVTKETMRGAYQLISFGYTFCPDVCPTTLQVLSLALDRLGEKAQQIQPYFISIDPKRDTVEKLRNYAGYFYPRLIALTGSQEMIDRVASEFKVRYEKVLEQDRDPDLYLMDHSASLYLFAPDGRFITKFAYGISAETLAKKLEEIIP